MDPQAQFGTGSPLLGGASPLQQVMAQRGVGQSATNQVTPSAPTFDPNTQPAMPPTAGAMPAMPQGQPMPSLAGDAGMGAPMPKSDTEIILAALTEKLKSETKIKESQLIPPKQSPVQGF